MKYVLLAILGILLTCSTAHAIKLNEKEMFWLTQNIYWESRNQIGIGQVMIAFVTINRMHDSRWPGTIKRVVTQPSQFSWYWDGKSDVAHNKEAWKLAQNVAYFVCAIYDEPENARYRDIFWYHRDDVNPSWNNDLNLVSFVQRHMFYSDLN